jgi:hypothetical protein
MILGKEGRYPRMLPSEILDPALHLQHFKWIHNTLLL